MCQRRADALTSGSVNYAKPILDLIADDTTTPTNIFTASGDAGNGYTLEWKTDPGFPANLSLPEGAVAQKFDATANAFKFFEIVATTPDPLTPNPADLIAQSIGKYVHPARLYYTVNTAAMIKDADYLSAGGHNTLEWADLKTNGGYTKAAIKSDTRSVILDEQVQYAVARLDVKTRVRNDVIIYDRGIGIPGDAYYRTQVANAEHCFDADYFDNNPSVWGFWYWEGEETLP